MIVAARDGAGTIGVAYDAKAVSYRAQAIPGQIQGFFNAAATRLLNDGVAVVNNSYGSTGGTSPLASASTQPGWEADFKRVTSMGRGGLGTVVVFAGGNDRSKNFITSYDPTNSSSYVINIAAASIDGTVTSYSTPGPNLLVAAPGSDPSSLVTTDRVGPAGYNKAADGNFTDTTASAFNGTSGAAPIATGVIALMLQANPKLGYRDVEDILVNSAKAPATGTATADTEVNGGIRTYSPDLGFGNIDALGAVRLAETWTKQSTAANLKTNVLVGTGGSVAAGATASFTTAATAAPTLRAQHVTVDVDLTAGSLSDVTLTLVSSSASAGRSLLLSRPAIATPMTTLTYSFDTVLDWGATIDPQRSYTLVVGNASTSTPMTVNAFNVNVMGDLATASKTFIYNNDYVKTAAADPSRQTLRDPGGAKDTINAAEVTGNSRIALRPGDIGSLGGTDFSVADTKNVRSIYSGDGNDELVGNDQDNVLGAGRGINTIDGGGGNDTAVLIGARTDYALGVSATGITVQSSDSVTQDTVTRVQTLQFDDVAADLTNAINGQFIAGSGAGEFGHAYAGPASGLSWEFAAITPQNVVVNANLANTYLRGGDGEDALAAKMGNNVLDGGGGSNFLVGGTGADSGRDTFFVDSLLGSRTVTTWDTVVNFHTGDTLTVWGYQAGRDSFTLQDNLGATGYTGATFKLSGTGYAGTSLVTLAGLSSSNPHLATTTGNAGGLSYLAVTFTA